MLVLKSLTFSGIGRFVEESSIDFTQLGSLVQVEGQNNVTGGSSGSGKSTIFKSLEFLLGINDISNSVLQSRLTKSSMSVTGVFDFDGQPLIIKRDKKLSIELNGEITTGSSKLSEERLDQILGMNRDLFRKILHKRQGEGGFFLQMSPSEVHRFLTDCLGLDKEQSKIVTLDERLKTLETNRISVLSAVESHKSALEATKSAIDGLGSPPILEVHPVRLEELKILYTGTLERIKLLKEVHAEEMKDLEKQRPQIQSSPFDRSKIVQLESEIGMFLANISELEKAELNRQSEIKSKISELQVEFGRLNGVELARQSEVKNKISALKTEVQKLKNVEQSRQSLIQGKMSENKIEQLKLQSAVRDAETSKREAIKLSEDLKTIRSSICPTCTQTWVSEQAKERESDILRELQKHKSVVMAGREADKKISDLKEQHKDLEEEFKPKAIPEINDAVETFKQLELESRAKPVPEAEAIHIQINALCAQSMAQSIPEAIEIRLKIDFKNQELVVARKEERDHQSSEDAKKRALLTEFNEMQEGLRRHQEAEIGLVRDLEARELSEYEAARNKTAAFEDAKKRYEDSVTKLQTQLSGYSGQLEARNKELEAVLEEIELAQEAKKAIKSYLSASFEDALDSISDMATRLIRNIPNMSTATIALEGLKETKTEGKIKEEVNAVISMDGEIAIPVKSLSGGERSAVDIGIDLAVIRFIEERTGKGVNLLVLDEFTNGLDTTCIENAIEMLKSFGHGKTILLVEHNPVISQSIENRLTVVRDGLTSKILQQ